MSERKMTDEEVKAVLTLVRGGWLRLELVDQPLPRPTAQTFVAAEPERVRAEMDRQLAALRSRPATQ